MKKVRDEEAAKRQQEVDARKEAEVRAKVADAARVKAENERWAVATVRDCCHVSC